MKKSFFAILLTSALQSAFGQEFSKTSQYGEATFAIGRSQGSLSLLYMYDWSLGERRKFVIGLGGRITSYVGIGQRYITAPAKLTSGGTGPLVIFKENIAENIDTFLVSHPRIHAVNVAINLTYRFTEKFSVGFNIDAVGFSFGKNVKGNYINGFTGRNNRPAQISAFNALLISDNDRGSLNSELYATYLFTKHWGVKAGVQFLFTEYTTEENLQQLPEENDRFRNKSLMGCIGASYVF